MTLHCKIFILSNVLWLTAALRTDDWPPQLIIDMFADKLHQIRQCQDEHNIDARTLIEFEESSDLKNLPNDQSLKCFMLCTYKVFKLVVPDSPKLQLVEFFGALSTLEYDARTIYLKMASGCKLRSKDMCEAVYQVNVCMKKNYNAYYYLVDGSDFWIQRAKAKSSNTNNNVTLVSEAVSPSET
ncbi:uncharacterized protein LOC119077924 [Bradysia coprophila]|uniref:uncharacterized protein LOC119077924 n=1 Tax=Bradysia coprophila TaxID=38358 RepID=UPI00187DB274|nr:uncharacterized protein LOC119077924 [Bradysia coprophila]